MHEMWVPVIYITNALEVEKLGSFGGLDMVSFWYKHPNIFQYNEVLKVKIHCKMDFQNFPFDQQNCSIKLRNWIGGIDDVNLNQPKIWYMDMDLLNSEIQIVSNKLNFNANFTSRESTTTTENGYPEKFCCGGFEPFGRGRKWHFL